MPKSDGPFNFDFGERWATDVVPHLDNPKLWREIEKGANGYLAQFPKSGKSFHPEKPPALYSCSTSYVDLGMRRNTEYIEDLRVRGKLPKKFADLERQLKEMTDEGRWDLIEERGISRQLTQERSALLRPLNAWNKVKYNLEAYCVFGACHWFNPTFGLTLARLVEPDEKWEVLRGRLHTTIVNQEFSKVFDLQYWCDGRRLENYLFGDECKKDVTMGGYDAFWNAVKE